MTKPSLDHESIIAALMRTRHSTELEILATKISSGKIGQGHLEIARALQHARHRIPNTEIPPNDVFDRALDALSEQWEALR